MSFPEVSVVMSVYNGANVLTGTLQSILDQQDCDLEFIVINDGSSDETGPLLDTWAKRDARLRVIHQANTGLTRALIRGCAEAQGEFIARQDCGDISLPGRLDRQVKELKRDIEAVAVSCHTLLVGPRDEPLYQTTITVERLNVGLAADSVEELKGPSHHGSVMFRSSVYRAVGAYRAAFYFAQDLDLWTRLRELGRFSVVDDSLYVARLEPRSISGTQTREQGQLAKLIWQACQARRAGTSEEGLLAEAAKIRPVHRG
jgi:glycosyltransferase involved in cell wall biosynthesis